MLRVLLLLAVILWQTPALAADCIKSKQLIDDAALSQDTEVRIRLLDRAAAACPSFTPAYELGKALFAKASTARSDAVADEAEQVFTRAYCLACNPKEQAMALGGLGQVALTKDFKHKAAYFFRMAQKRNAFKAVEDKLSTLEEKLVAEGSTSKDIENVLGAELPCEEISECQTKGAFSPQVVETPSANVYILFRLDSAELDPAGEAAARTLAQGIKGFETTQQRTLKRRVVHILGHTDARGDADYNQKLSLRRAETVKAFIVRTQGLDPALLVAEGRGKSELLRAGNSESDHKANRRVEIKAE